MGNKNLHFTIPQQFATLSYILHEQKSSIDNTRNTGVFYSVYILMKKNKAIQFLQYSILIIFSALPQLYFGHKIKNNSFPS